MSNPLRVAAAVEGPTDVVVLRAVLEAVLTDIEFEFHTVQPEGSVAFGATTGATTGTGWVGIYRWSRQAADEGGGSVSGSAVFAHHDVLVVQIDADVATKTYACGSVTDAPRDDLPCSVRKSRAAYEGRRQQISVGWPTVAADLTEAGRFHGDLLAAIDGVG